MPCRTLDSILEQENMSLLLGNQTVKGKGASCFVLVLHSSGRKKGGGGKSGQRAYRDALYHICSFSVNRKFLQNVVLETKQKTLLELVRWCVLGCLLLFCSSLPALCRKPFPPALLPSPF